MPLDDVSGVLGQQDELFGPDPSELHQQQLNEWIKSVNIAIDGDIDEDELRRIGSRCKHEYSIDYNSCGDWRDKYQEYLDFALQIAEEKTYPWPQASNIIFPLLTTASIQFAARAYPTIIGGPLVVKGIVVGTDHGNPQIDPNTGQQAQGPQGPVWITAPGIKRIRANHIAKHMSWQLLSEQREWESDTDKLLHLLPIVGCVFRKSYFDPSIGRNCSDLIPADKLIVNYHAKSFETAPRLTEEILLYPFEVEELIRSGVFVDQTYPRGGDDTDSRHSAGDDDAPIEFLEQHRRLDLDNDGYAEPYIVTIHKSTAKVARITARYDPEGVIFSQRTQKIVKIVPVQYYTKYDFLPSPDGGIYGTGFGRLLSPINAAINTTLNQLIDAGHLQIRGGGFIGKGLSMHTGNVRFQMGEYKAVNVTGGVLRDNLVPLTFPGPSPVLFQLLGLLIDAGKEVASVKDVLSGDISASNVPATTTMALIEQGLKVFSSIYKRIYRSLTTEFEKLYRLNRLYLPEMSSYRFGDEWHYIKRSDYDEYSGVEPVGDPSKVADMQRLARAQFLLQFAGSPNCNATEILTRVFDEAKIPNYEQLLVTNPPPNPAIIAKISEVASSAARDRAAEMKDIAMAIQYMAQARKLSDDVHLNWFDQQLESFRLKLDQTNATHEQEQAQSQQAAGNRPPPPSEEDKLKASDLNHPGMAPQPPSMAPGPMPPHPGGMPMGGGGGPPAGPPPGPGGPPRPGGAAPLPPQLGGPVQGPPNIRLPPGGPPNMNLNHFDPLKHMPPTPSALTPSLWQAALAQGPQLPPNARQGHDGNYYVPDVHRPGKYMMVMPGR
jgi:chaperonin GroES